MDGAHAHSLASGVKGLSLIHWPEANQGMQAQMCDTVEQVQTNQVIGASQAAAVGCQSHWQGA